MMTQQKLFAYLNLIYGIARTPVVCLGNRDRSILYQIGMRGALNINAAMCKTILGVAQDHRLLKLRHPRTAGRILYAYRLRYRSSMEYTVLLLPNPHDQAHEDHYYLDLLDLIHSYVSGAPLPGREELAELPMPDDLIWDTLYPRAPERFDGPLVYNTLYVEKRILSSVRTGNAHSILGEIEEYLSLAMQNIYAPNRPIIEKRKTLYTMTTMVYMEAVSGGVTSKEGLRILQGYHNRIGKLQDGDSIEMFVQEMLTDFVERVKHERQKNYTRPVRYCADYILSHLYDKITLEQIAGELEISPNYLSTLFKKEYGLSFREYLIHARIEEAKKLVAYSELSFSEIAALLSFSDQSHFSRTFRKYTDMSPSEYRGT